jgi:arylsulfatase A
MRMWAIIAGALLTSTLGAAETGRPNIVVLLCDDLGYGDLGSYGHPTIRTPHLDKLASQGTRFTACYSGAPVCSPARAALMTGRHPYRYGIRDWIPEKSGIHLYKDEKTVARLLRSAGYRTCLVGKWHLNSQMDDSEPTPGDHGFDHWFATQNNAAPSHQNPTNFIRNGKPAGPLMGNASTLVIDEALRWLDTKSDQPFALFVCFHAPHEPVATPDAFTQPYATIADAPQRTYFGSVSLVDHEVGRLLGELDKRQLTEQSLVWFTSDNGPETLKRYKGATHSHGSAGPLRGMKLHLTEGGIRVPGIIRWPGHTKPGTVTDEPISGIDVLPTLCAVGKSAPPNDRFVDGADIQPALSGQPVARKTALYWQYDKALGGPWRVAIRQGPWKLLADAKLQQFALYDVVADIGEKDDRSAAEPQRVATMSAELQRLHTQINAGSVRRADP